FSWAPPRIRRVMMCVIFIPILLRHDPQVRWPVTATVESRGCGSGEYGRLRVTVLSTLYSVTGSTPLDSRLHNRPVPTTQRSPLQIERRVVLDRKFRRQILVQVHSPSRLVIGVVITVPDLRAAGKDILFGLVEEACFLNAEVGH